MRGVFRFAAARDRAPRPAFRARRVCRADAGLCLPFLVPTPPALFPLTEFPPVAAAGFRLYLRLAGLLPAPLPTVKSAGKVTGVDGVGVAADVAVGGEGMENES